MAKLQIGSLPSTPRGSGVSITNVETNETRIFFVPANLPSGVDQAAAGLFAGIGLANNEAQRAGATLLPQLIGPHMAKTVPGLLQRPYASFVDAVSASARSNKKSIAEIAAVPAATIATAAVRQRAIQLFDQITLDSEKIRFSLNATLPQLQGLVEVDAFSNFPGNVQSAIMDRYLEMAYATKYGLASKYPAIASPDIPIPSGIDQDAVDAEAQKFVKGVRDYEKQIANCSQIARDCIAYVAVACSCDVATAFGLLTNKT